jgi:DNA-binding XRE family transcriptional regulator
MSKLDLHIRLKHARKELSLNQVEIANDLSIQQKTISEIENGKILNIPNTYIYYFYQKGVSLEWLYDNKGKMMKADNEPAKIENPSPLQLDLLFEKFTSNKGIKNTRVNTTDISAETTKEPTGTNELLFERLIDAKDLTINSLLTFVKSQENQVEFLKTLINRLDK